jgi:tetratricopeptide (TPR) repeat protein
MNAVPAIGRRWLRVALAAGLAFSAMPRAVANDLVTVNDALEAWDVETAESTLKASPPGPDRALKLGIVALYRGRYAEAERVLTELLAEDASIRGSQTAESARHYLALARGAQQALGNPVVVRSDDGFVEASFADEKDALLAPYLFDAMEQARDVLGAELGVVPDHAIRFEFFETPAKLAMITPLTIDNIRTTGTVGVTKYRKIMMISPRAMLYGYGWLDTAVHEYVHYVLTIRTRNRAPVWLQEGLAKLFETRWRMNAPAPLDPAAAFRLHRALMANDLVTFDEMQPSLAMLPTAERAALAYSQVETMLQLLAERRGRTGLGTLLDRVAAGDDAESALAVAWGAPFSDFLRQWEIVMKRRTSQGREGPVKAPEFKDAENDVEAAQRDLRDVFSNLGGGRARQHARLGTLLHVRGHARAATIQYEKARAADARARRDPELARRLGRLYVDLGQYDRAVTLLGIAAQDDPDDANLAAAQGRALLRSGKQDAARMALGRAVRNNPFIPTIHCDLAELAKTDSDRAREQALCKE